MTAALSADWDQIHRRSRSFTEDMTREQEASRQIAAARQIRVMLLQSGDMSGLRALRLAVAAPMAAWLQNRQAKAAAQSLGRDLDADQREAIPELARLEDQLALAQGRLG